ncbi:alcohol dehydrogenase catalytic domain-containing protein [Thermodesulfobacteriota bacterium]
MSAKSFQLQLTGVGTAEATSPGGDGQPILEIRACGICHSDRKAFAAPPAGMRLPRVLGHEVAGILMRDLPAGNLKAGAPVVLWPALACGRCTFCRNGHQNLCPTIRLFGYHLDGGYRETLPLPPEEFEQLVCFPIPAGVSFVSASFAEPIACLCNGLNKIPSPLASLLVQGAGLMGRLAIRLARALWPECEIFVNDIDETRFRAAREEASGYNGEQVAAALIAASSAKALSATLDVLAPGGSVILFSGFPAAEKQFTLDHNRLHQREQTLVGAYGCTPENMQQALFLLGNGSIPVADLISKKLPLREAGSELARPQQAADMKSVIVFE